MQRTQGKRAANLSFNLKELENFAQELAKTVKGGEVIALIGELGAGKTAFVKAFLKSKGIHKKVTSPTFSLMVPYTYGKITYHHVDLYRMSGVKEFAALGILEQWKQGDSVFLIEWADKIKNILPADALVIRFEKESDPKLRNRRKVFLSGSVNKKMRK